MSDEAHDIKGIIRRRKRPFLLISGLLLAVTVIVTLALPPVYRAASTILIEGQQIPEEYVRTTITSYVEERLQVITQQIMRRSKLLEIIKQFSLYANLRGRYTTEEIIEKMRDAIRLEPISAEVMDRRTGRPSTATIAFEISFEGRSSATVYRVANVLASLYLEENLRAREEQASTTTRFLQRELDELKTHIDGLEEQISYFKERHMGQLPEYNALNIQTIERLNRDLDRLNGQIRSLQERKIYLEGQLATVDPVLETPEALLRQPHDPRARLKELRLQLVGTLARVSDLHPDVKRLQNEIADLEQKVGELDDTDVKLARLEELENEMAELRGRVGPEHPDVTKLTREIEVLNAGIRAAPPADVAMEVWRREEKIQENPVYINLKTQVASTAMEIRSLNEERQQTKEKVAEYQKRLERAPAVEREYSALSRDYQNTQRRYNEVLTKLNQARLAQGLEENQSGERFTIVDPAQQPERPYKPNRIALILVGLILSLGAGVGVAAIKENLDETVKSANEVATLTSAPVLTTLPVVWTREERRNRLLRRTLWTLAAVAAVAGLLFLVHHAVMPLDLLWLKLQRRFTVPPPM